jgi:adenylylsulfate kinase
MIYWLTGQPGSGKTTIAKEMMTLNHKMSKAFHIDGDDIRELFDNKDYSETGRRKNIQLAQQIAQYLNSKGETVIVSLVSPYKDQRDTFKEKMGDDILEVYVHTNEIRGRESFFVENYEKPTDDYFYMCTDNIKVNVCAKVIIGHKSLLTHHKNTDEKNSHRGG